MTQNTSSHKNTVEPSAIQAALLAAATHLENRNFPEFDVEISKAEELAPNHPEVAHFKGLALFEQKKADEAFALVLNAARAQPRNAAVKHNLAAIQISLGQFEDAKQNLLSALSLKEDYAEAYHTLAGIHKFTKGDPLISSMEELAQSGKFTPADASFLCFALAKAYDDAGLPDRAWEMLRQANAQMDPGYEADRQDQEVADTLTVCSAEFIAERSRYGHPSRAPIFIVGMPRSGTTLLESLLDDHPQVFAAGELPIIPVLGRRFAERQNTPPFRHGHGPALAALKPGQHHGGGLGYLNGVRRASPRWFDYFVDKLPDNSFNLGLIACVLPNAKILHIMRHPLDVMLSIYFQRFTSVPYSFRPEDIVHHWKNYRRMMDHWRRVLPKDTLLELRYENLVQDKDFAQEFLWNSLGLTHNVGHIPSTRRDGEQRTASRWQVKQPVYKTSLAKFRKYEAHMSPFIDAIGGTEIIEAEVADQEARCALGKAAGG